MDKYIVVILEGKFRGLCLRKVRPNSIEFTSFDQAAQVFDSVEDAFGCMKTIGFSLSLMTVINAPKQDRPTFAPSSETGFRDSK